MIQEVKGCCKSKFKLIGVKGWRLLLGIDSYVRRKVTLSYSTQGYLRSKRVKAPLGLRALNPLFTGDVSQRHSPKDADLIA